MIEKESLFAIYESEEEKPKKHKMSNFRKAYVAGKTIKKIGSMVSDADTIVGGAKDVVIGLKKRDYSRAAKGGIEMGDALYNGTKTAALLGLQYQRIKKAQEEEDKEKEKE